MPVNNAKKPTAKTPAGKNTAVKKSSQGTKKPAQRQAPQRASAKRGEPIVLARVSREESWKPLAKTQTRSKALNSSRMAQNTVKRNARPAEKSKKSKKNNGMTDAKLIKITVGCIFGAIFLIAVLVFLFNAFELKLW